MGGLKCVSTCMIINFQYNWNCSLTLARQPHRGRRGNEWKWSSVVVLDNRKGERESREDRLMAFIRSQNSSQSTEGYREQQSQGLGTVDDNGGRGNVGQDGFIIRNRSVLCFRSLVNYRSHPRSFWDIIILLLAVLERRPTAESSRFPFQSRWRSK